MIVLGETKKRTHLQLRESAIPGSHFLDPSRLVRIAVQGFAILCTLAKLLDVHIFLAFVFRPAPEPHLRDLSFMSLPEKMQYARLERW
jgi:hypothetical protein